MKNLVIRAISGAIFVGIMIAAIWLPPFLFGLIFLLLTILGLREFYSLMDKINGIKTKKYFSIITGCILYIVTFLYTFEYFSSLVFLIYIPFIVLLFIIELFRKENSPIQNIAISLMGQIYIALPFSFVTIMEGEHKIFVLAFFLMIWASDTGAYLVGICIGKHKMFERVSPKKTWEGFGGGLIFALITGFIFSKVPVSELSFQLWQWLLFAFFVFIFGTLGDLIESLFKRYLKVKDSGSLMPGHGGVLDRFDSAIIAAPIAFVLLKFLLEYSS